MEYQRVASICLDGSVFGSPPQSRYPRSRESLTKVDRKRSPQVGPARFDALDTTTFKYALQSADGCLDFGQLRHRRDMADGAQAR
jgi:hypothetical protein